MNALLQTLLSGVVGFVGGAAALWAQQRFVWRPQKRTELRNKVFDDAMSALAMFEVDALDPALQKDKASYSGDCAPHTVLRRDTRVALQKTRSQVKAFFSDEAFAAFDSATRADVRLDNIPNNDGFAEKADQAIKLMALELGLLDRPKTADARQASAQARPAS